jgi:hypothetical protein
MVLGFRYCLRVLVASLAIGLVLVLAPPAALAGVIYLDPNGYDTQDGSEPGKAVATLAKAVKLALQRSSSQGTGENMTVRVAPGFYFNQTLMLNERQMRGALTIDGASPSAGLYPVFFGDGTSTWLRYEGSSGRATRLTITRVNVTNYATVISLNGRRDDPKAFNHGTTITGNLFTRIGTDSQDPKNMSTAALRLVNSRDNVIQNNIFKTIRSVPLNACGLLHPIYVAHNSSGNRIIGNTFEDFCGAAIKLRDQSDRNLISHNRFYTQDVVNGVEEWFCDLDKNVECTKNTGECPSVDNVVQTNVFLGFDPSRQVVIRGGRQPRSWCSSNSFVWPRFLGNDAGFLTER